MDLAGSGPCPQHLQDGQFRIGDADRFLDHERNPFLEHIGTTPMKIGKVLMNVKRRRCGCHPRRAQLSHAATSPGTTVSSESWLGGQSWAVFWQRRVAERPLVLPRLTRQRHSLTPACRFDRGDVDLCHLRQGDRRDLPAHSPFVLAPAAGALLAADQLLRRTPDFVARLKVPRVVAPACILLCLCGERDARGRIS